MNILSIWLIIGPLKKQKQQARGIILLVHVINIITPRVLRVSRELQKNRNSCRNVQTCYDKKNGTQSQAVKDAINKMSEKEKEHPELAIVVDSQNDLYAQVMGREKHGRARMYGAGVSPSITFNDMSSSKVNQNALIKTLLEHNNKLQNELSKWKSQTNVPARVPQPTPEIEHVDSDPTQSPDDISPIIQVANRRTPENKTVDSDSTQPPDDITPIYQVASRRDWALSFMDSGDSLDRNLQVGSVVCLKSIIKQTQTITVGILYSSDLAQEVNGRALGPDHYEIYIQFVAKPDERLISPCKHCKTIGDTIGMNIVWPKPFVFLEDGSRLNRMNG